MKPFPSSKVLDHFFGSEKGFCLTTSFGEYFYKSQVDQSHSRALLFGDREVGAVFSSGKFSEEQNNILQGLAPIFAPPNEKINVEHYLKLWDWVYHASKLVGPSVADWIGLYFKSGVYWGEEGTDLVLGPFIGEPTDHVRIPLDRGFCGMALREEKSVNIADVTQDTTHIACSLKTRSELVIPLKSRSGDFIAELDIDCNRLNAFDKSIESEYHKYAESYLNI